MHTIVLHFYIIPTKIWLEATGKHVAIYLQLLFLTIKLTLNLFGCRWNVMIVATFFDHITLAGVFSDKSSRASLAITDHLSASPIGLITSFIVLTKQVALVLNVKNWFVV